MSTLVTGASGFIGRHLVPACGGDVRAFQGDVGDAAAFADLPRAETLYHLAALSSPKASVADPVGTWRVNAQGTLNVLEWARRADVRRIVLVSTAHVYGPAQYSPIDEKHPTLPVSPYGASKLAAEALGRAYHAAYGLGVVIVRPFNVYGPGQARGFLVPDILHQLREGKALRLGDPRPVRDFTYVSDAVAMLRAAGTRPGIEGQAFNLGSGEGHSVAEVAAKALAIAGSKLEPAWDPARSAPGDVRELVVDNRRAREALGWSPRVGLEDGLRRTWEAMAG